MLSFPFASYVRCPDLLLFVTYPRVFDAEVADIFDATVNYGTAMKYKCFRLRNNNDIVARVPPLPYKHVGTEIYFDRL